MTYSTGNMRNALIYLTYNSEANLRRNWAPLLQVQHPLSCYVLDNASTDGGPTLLEKAGVTVHRNTENVYYTRAINQALRAIWDQDWEWVFIVNPDVTCPAQWDALMVDQLTPYSDVGIVGARLVNSVGSVVHAGGMVAEPQTLFWNSHFDLRDTWGCVQREAVTTTQFRHRVTDSKTVEKSAWVTFAAVALRKKLLEQIGLLDETWVLYCSDAQLCMRAWAAGWQVIYNGGVTFEHEGSASVKQAGSIVHEVAKDDLRRFSLTEEPQWLQSLGVRPPWKT